MKSEAAVLQLPYSCEPLSILLKYNLILLEMEYNGTSGLNAASITVLHERGLSSRFFLNHCVEKIFKAVRCSTINSDC